MSVDQKFLTGERKTECAPLNKNDKTVELKIKTQDSNNINETRTYKRRWFMLIIFTLVSFFNAYQWIQYTIVANIIMKFYNVSAVAVNLTATIYLIVFVPLLFPSSYIMDKKGLKWAMLLGAGGTCLGSWIKIFSVEPDRFYVSFFGQIIVASAQLFTLSTPARLAATWFPENEISTACGLGVIGVQLGVSLGFLFTPMFVQNHDSLHDIAEDLKNYFLIIAIFTTVVLIFVIFFFQKEPPVPPNLAQAKLRKENFIKKNNVVDVFNCFKRLFKNQPFQYLLVGQSIIMGTYCAISTLLNEIVLFYFPGNEQFAGQIGLFCSGSGVLSSFVFGIIMDKTRKYKETCIFVYLSSALGFLLITFSLTMESKIIVLASSIIFGTFISCSSFVSFEVAAELTYPEPESNSSGLLNCFIQIAGISLTFILKALIDLTGVLFSNMATVGLLSLGTLITLLMPNIQKRQEALKSSKAIYTCTNLECE